MSPDDRWRVSHMIEAAEQALSFASGRGREDLHADVMLRLALTRAIEVVGEAATKVSEQGRAELPDVPWPQVVGMPGLGPFVGREIKAAISASSISMDKVRGCAASSMIRAWRNKWAHQGFRTRLAYRGQPQYARPRLVIPGRPFALKTQAGFSPFCLVSTNGVHRHLA